MPYRNPYALASYYVGVFSLVPCLGIPLALTAIPLGIVGLRHARRNPTAHGGAHAWTGIVLAVISILYQGIGFPLLMRV